MRDLHGSSHPGHVRAAELALRWFESDITWYGRWENWKVRDDEGSPSSPTNRREGAYQ